MSMQTDFKEVFVDHYSRLCKFEKALIDWNKKFSFTSVPDAEIFERLIAPSAWLGMRYATEDIGTVADFGCGAGIPGAVMAIVDRRNKYLMLDSNRKKIGFIKHCLTIDGLYEREMVNPMAIRVATDTELPQINRLVSRAAGSMAEVMGLFHVKQSAGIVGTFFKGSDAEKETEELIVRYPDAKVETLSTPDWFCDLKLLQVFRAT